MPKLKSKLMFGLIFRLMFRSTFRSSCRDSSILRIFFKLQFDAAYDKCVFFYIWAYPKMVGTIKSWFSSQNCYETTHYQNKFLSDNGHWPLRLYKCSIVCALLQLGCVPPNALLDWENCKFFVVGDRNRTCRRPVVVTKKMSMLSCVCGYTEKNEYVRLTVYWDRQNYSAGHQSILKLSLPGHTFIIQSLINNILPDFVCL